MLLMTDSFGIRNALINVFLSLDSIIYSLISYLFQVFNYLASAEIFSSDVFQELTYRVYIIVGVAALFLIAFSLLQSLVNPDDITKGKNSPIKVIKNVLISIVLLGATPMLFNFAYEVQNRVIRSNILSKLILGGKTVSSDVIDCDETTYLGDGQYDFVYAGETLESPNIEANLEYIGHSMSLNLFSAFFVGEGAVEIDENTNQPINNKDGQDYRGKNINTSNPNINLVGLTALVITNPFIGTFAANAARQQILNNRNLCATFETVKVTGDFSLFDSFTDNTLKKTGEEGKINYTFGLSSIVGIAVIYLLFSFCIGLGVRAVKLAYYQVIAPVPILARVVPQSQKIFDNWLKGLLSTFAEVFVRLIIIYFGIFMVETVITGFFNIALAARLPGVTRRVIILAKVLLILGMLIFMKKAPQFLTDMVGIKSGSLKLGIKDQIREAALIGKPIATGMDKAQGLVTGGLGAGWSYLKGSVFRRKRPEGGNIWDAVKYGAMTGVKSGGKQFSAGKDAEFTRETNKEGSDSIWGAIDRRSKAYVAAEKKKARAAYDEIIAQVESSPKFAEAMQAVVDQAMESEAVKIQMEKFINNMKAQFISDQFDSQKEANDNFLNELKSSPDFNKYKNEGMSDDDALRKIAGDKNATDRLTEALDQTGELLKTRLAKEFDDSQKAEAEKQFEWQYRVDHDNELKQSASKIVQQTDQLYKQAVAGHEAFVKSENQKDFKAVLEKMMKDEKEKGGGASSSKDNDKK